jgi:hypothetical protein
LDSSQGSELSLLFSIREVASAAIIAGDMQAMTDVSEMARKLISVCEEAMTIISCANKASGTEREKVTPSRVTSYTKPNSPRLEAASSNAAVATTCASPSVLANKS